MDSVTVKKLAGQVGFDLCGICAAEAVPEAAKRYRKWLHDGNQADMEWMANHADRRADASKLADGLKSVVVLGLNYYLPNCDSVPEGWGRVSRYARGRDYHKVIHTMLRTLVAKIEKNLNRDAKLQPPATFKHWVDYGPMLERAYAVKAGLGFIGKNSNLINHDFGSWVFLGEIVTSLQLQPDQVDPAIHGACRTCRRCIDECPTGAITDGRTVDSRKCLSYLTIEHKGRIRDRTARAMGLQVFGCDICQDVCPLNEKRQQPASHPDLQPSSGVGELLDCTSLVAMESEDEFLALAAGTALMRAKLAGLQRNARIVIKNGTK